MDKDLLKKRVLEVQDALKQIKGVGAQDIRNFTDEVTVTRRGRLRLVIDFDAEEMIGNEKGAANKVSSFMG